MDRPAAPVRSLDTERNARELLARWSTQNLLEPPPSSGASVSSTNAPADSRTGGPAMANKHGLRFDSAHMGVPAPSSSPAGSPTNASVRSDEQVGSRSPRRKHPRRPRIADTPHRDAPAAPSSHDELVRSAIEQPSAKRTNWTATAGQLCAYGGVGLLTCGTVLVLSGHFGGPANYAPSGWLIAAVGQMLLFLGVVTLVSGGMEQTVDEVAWRMDHLAERIVHLEHLLEERDARERRARREQMRLRSQEQSSRDQADAA